MTQSGLKRLAALILLGLGGFGVFAAGSQASARPPVAPARYVLRGTGLFSRSVASAIVTRLSSDQFRLSLIAEPLPPPASLHAKFARHAYVAWLVDGVVMHGPMRMAAVGLAPGRECGSYAGQGIVRIGGVTSVIITAEPTAQAKMPILPELTVLASADHQM